MRWPRKIKPDPGNRIEWTLQDPHLDYYVIEQNGTVVGEGDWISASTLVLMSYSVDGLSIGTYNFTISVYDESGNNAYDQVWIYIVDDSTTSTTTSTTSITNTTNTTDLLPPEMMQMISLVITIAGVTVIVVFVILIMKSRKTGMYEGGV